MLPNFPYSNAHQLNLDWILERISKAITSVNGTTPDENGNVNLPGVAGVSSVLGIGPDGSGNVQFSESWVPGHNYVSVTEFGAAGDGVADDSAAIQQALNTNSAVFFPAGTYICKDVKIPSHKRMLGSNAVLIPDGASNIMRNDGDGITSSYTQNEDIIIEGLEFDMQNTICTGLAFGHCNKIVIKNCNFKNCVNWHMIELNAAAECRILSCHFYNQFGNTEMIQIDSMVNQGVFPWFGPVDGMGCMDIIVDSCQFENQAPIADGGTFTSAIGNHSTNPNFPICSRLVFSNNTVRNLGSIGKFVGVENSLFVNNTGTNMINGFWLDQSTKNVIIANNNITGNKNAPSLAFQSRGIAVFYPAENTHCINNQISGFLSHGITLQGEHNLCGQNTITNCDGIGIYCGWYENDSMYYDNISKNNTGVDIYLNFMLPDGVTYTLGHIYVHDNNCDDLRTAGGEPDDPVFIYHNVTGSINNGLQNVTVKDNIINGTWTA